MPMPDMTNWPPQYIREYLADQQKAFEANQQTNRALNAIPPDDAAARAQMSPQGQIQIMDALKRQQGSLQDLQRFMPLRPGIGFDR